jgi:hypothetical protein
VSDTRFVGTRGLISRVIRSGQQFLNKSLNFAFLVNMIAQLRVLILFEQNLEARFCMKPINIGLLNVFSEISVKLPFLDDVTLTT